METKHGGDDDPIHFACDLATSTPAKRCVLHLRFYTKVTNADALLQTVIDKRVPLSLINPKMVPGIYPIISAAELAVLAESHNATNTRSLHSEIVFNLSPNRNIASSLKAFGVQPGASELIVACVDPSADLLASLNGDASAISSTGVNIVGTPTPLSQLRAACDEAAIKKVYKIDQKELGLGGQRKDDLLDAVLIRVGTKPIG